MPVGSKFLTFQIAELTSIYPRDPPSLDLDGLDHYTITWSIPISRLDRQHLPPGEQGSIRIGDYCRVTNAYGDEYEGEITHVTQFSRPQGLVIDFDITAHVSSRKSTEMRKKLWADPFKDPDTDPLLIERDLR